MGEVPEDAAFRHLEDRAIREGATGRAGAVELTIGVQVKRGTSGNRPAVEVGSRFKSDHRLDGCVGKDRVTEEKDSSGAEESRGHWMGYPIASTPDAAMNMMCRNLFWQCPF